MYLDIVLIDYLSPNGILTTYRIKPKADEEKVVVDRLGDIDTEFKSPDSIDIGATRIYNYANDSIRIQQARLRGFQVNVAENAMSFSLEHMGVPVGSKSQAHIGYYNFVLSPAYRFLDLHIVDPYDRKTEDYLRKKHFRYETLWDTSCNMSLATMELSSSRGTFSFQLYGKAQIYKSGQNSDYLKCTEITRGVSELIDYPISSESRQTITDDIMKKSEWLELKPNIAGIGINLNAIIRDGIKAFQQKRKRRKS